MSKGKEKKRYSEFAEALRRLLYDTNIFTIKEWGELLGVTPPAISQWLTDGTMPRPEFLRMIVGEVKRSSGVPPDVLEQFEAMASKPASDVLPSGRNLEGSINSYLVSPLLNGFLRDLQRLGPTKQEKVLLRASEDCAIEAGIIERVERPPMMMGNPGPFILPPHEASKSAEDVLASLGEKEALLLDLVTKYLTGSSDENLWPIAKNFCLHALTYVRSQNDTAPRRIMEDVIKRMSDDIKSFPHLHHMEEALNLVFMADEETVILVKCNDSKFRRLNYTLDWDGIEEDVRTISANDVQYAPVDRLGSYDSINLNELNPYSRARSDARDARAGL